ncbi:hypothetical protein, partial [Microcoleus sp. Pol12B5]|uniref:hypothetical protein n=1 Tax=Microcoleus sp. Pol12B5 TaxID=3055396 RepID=UPI002FD2CF59
VALLSSHLFDSLSSTIYTKLDELTLLSEEAKEHILDLIYAHNNQGLTRAGKSKLDNYLVLEHQMTLIKQLTNTSLKI